MRQFKAEIAQNSGKYTYFQALPVVSLIPLLLFNSCTKADKNTSEKEKLPNIVLILADDMGFSDIGCYGGEIHTPHLDQLAKEGIRFTQFYNSSRCSPTRASLLTGLYSHQTGFGFMDGNLGAPGYEGYLNNQCITIAEALKPAGYKTMLSGKWHLGGGESNEPNDRGFDRFYGTIPGAGSFYTPAGLMYDKSPVKSNSPDYYYTDAISDTAVQFILQHTKTTQNPFFLYVSFTAPHWPLHAPEETIDKYKGMYSAGWDSVRLKRYNKMIKLGIIDSSCEMSPLDNSIEKWENEENKAWRERCMEVYAAQVDIMDQGIGRIVEILKKTNQLDNTVIFFLSDNGGCSVGLEETSWLTQGGLLPAKAPDGSPMRPNSTPDIMPGPSDTYAAYGLPWANVSNTPFRKYKSFVHEGGITTPLIVYWPDGIQVKNTFVRQPAHVIDVMATCLDLAGLEYPLNYGGEQLIPLEGKSFLPLLQGDEQPVHDTLFWEHTGKRAVRAGKWKLVSLPDKEWELYDLDKDRTELNDLSRKFPDKVWELEKAYNSWAQRCGVLSFSDFQKARNR